MKRFFTLFLAMILTFQLLPMAAAGARDDAAEAQIIRAESMPRAVTVSGKQLLPPACSFRVSLSGGNDGKILVARFDEAGRMQETAPYSPSEDPISVSFASVGPRDYAKVFWIDDAYRPLYESVRVALYESSYAKDPEGSRIARAEMTVDGKPASVLYIDNEVICEAADGVTKAAVELLAAGYGGRVVGCVEMLNHYQVEFDGIESLDQLNALITDATMMKQPPSDKGKRLKLFYITQAGVKPPTFVIFVNDKELMHFSYTRYIENQIRETFGFMGTPLKFIIRERKED